jgi:signal transduction histidine kinase
VRQLAIDAAERLGFPPRVRFSGPIDSVVDRDVGEQLLAVLRESLSNVIRHAAATAVGVEVGVEVNAAAGRALVLRVSDDGVGTAPESSTGFGLRNMAARAAALGGTFDVGTRPPRGTVVEWRVPLGDPHT